MSDAISFGGFIYVAAAALILLAIFLFNKNLAGRGMASSSFPPIKS